MKAKNIRKCKECGLTFHRCTGKFCSRRCYENYMSKHPNSGTIKRGQKRPEISGENHYYWKGENAGYRAKHIWISNAFGKPQQCENCETREKRRYHWANLSGEYLRIRSDWKRLCPSCHKVLDRKNWIDSVPQGEGRWNAKINQFQIDRILLMKETVPKLSQRKLAKIFNSNQATIGDILNHKHYLQCG